MSPLLAVYEQLQLDVPGIQGLLVGTQHGPERVMAQTAGIPFVPIPAGKLRRYFSWTNVVSPLLVVAGFIKSFSILRSYKPDVVFGAGSFVQVPLLWAAWLLGIPVVIHQQDVLPGLANRLCAVCAKRITVTCEESLKDFSVGSGLLYKKNLNKVTVTGNPVRKNLVSLVKTKALEQFGFNQDFPTVLILGGGTGSEFINRITADSLPVLQKIVQVIHVTGKGKSGGAGSPHYVAFDFLADMSTAYSAADIVVCRAGMSTLAELSELSKIAILIPMPDSHQEFNALYAAKNRAAVVVLQQDLNAAIFVKIIRKLLFDYNLQKELSHTIHQLFPKGASEKIARIIISLTDHGLH